MSAPIPVKVQYVSAARAQRQANARAVRSKLTDADRRVLAAVLDEITSYSKLLDHVTPKRIASTAHVSSRSARRSLPKLAALGIIVYLPGGRGPGNVSIIGVPPNGEKVDTWLATLGLADLATLGRPEGGQKPALKVDSPRARESSENQEEEPKLLYEEGPNESRVLPSRPQLATAASGGTAGEAESAGTRSWTDDEPLLAVAEKTPQERAERERRETHDRFGAHEQGLA